MSHLWREFHFNLTLFVSKRIWNDGRWRLKRKEREGKSTIYKCTIYKPDICRISVGIEPKYIYKAQTLKLFGQKWAKPQDQIWNNLKSSSSIWENPPELPINPNFETMNWVQPNTISDLEILANLLNEFLNLVSRSFFFLTKSRTSKEFVEDLLV